MKILFLLIALVLAYLVGQVHLMYLIRTNLPAAWLIMQAEQAGFKTTVVEDQDEQKEGKPLE